MDLNTVDFKTVQEVQDLLSDLTIQSPLSYLFDGINEILAAVNPDKPLDFTSLGFTNEDLQQYWVLLYGDKFTAFPWDTGINGDLKSLTKLKNLINFTTRANKNSLYSKLYVFNVKYNPINNYDLVEEGLDGFAKGEVQNDQSATTTPNNYGSITNGSVEKQIAPYDGGLKDESRTTYSNYGSTMSGTLTTAGGNTQTYYNTAETHSIDLDGQTKTITGNEIKQHAFKRSGNIGVTTTQQMLESEIELKKMDAVKEFYSLINNYILLHVWN